ncbi:MAG TPA: hypothetical protein VMK12_29540 [Anaeromyxobacteraceae bacterium]|nr:hypothetical protein [Anaeromyxobacteraceae bacterium]
MGWARQMVAQGWEVLDPPVGPWTAAFFTFRKRVDGGWLVRSVYVGPYDTRPQHVTLAFVPERTDGEGNAA